MNENISQLLVGLASQLNDEDHEYNYVGLGILTVFQNICKCVH
jgi:hypothetical protein